MAKNKSPVEIQKRAEKRFERTKRKEKVKENRKIIKEFNRQERNARLPGFIITIVAFILLIGVFMGLYSSYDYKLMFLPREFIDIDITNSSDIIGSKLEVSFAKFFSLLSGVTRVSNKIVNIFSISDDYSDNPDVNVYLLSLSSTGIAYINANEPLISQSFLRSSLDNYLTSLSNPSTIKIFLGYIYPGEMHSAYVHKNKLSTICDSYGWNYLAVSLKFQEFEFCYLDDNNVLHCFCEYEYLD